MSSGFAVVLTNDHVVQGADTVQVTLKNGTTHPASVIGTDPAQDVAVLQVNGHSGLRTSPALCSGAKPFMGIEVVNSSQVGTGVNPFGPFGSPFNFGFGFGLEHRGLAGE
jgi:S1-C subfamily serine protease